MSTACNLMFMYGCIVPYFGDCKMNEITASDIIQWQNEMLQMNFSDSYLRMLQNQMTALFTHVSKIYNLKNNPCKKVKKMGRSDSRSLTFWTLEEYEKFFASIDKDSRYYVLFETLFWTGMRIGELLALTKEDVDLKNNQININKTFYRTGGKDIITSPKTEQSIRVVEIPQFLADELREYLEHVYGLPDTERIFPVGCHSFPGRFQAPALQGNRKVFRLFHPSESLLPASVRFHPSPCYEVRT